MMRRFILGLLLAASSVWGQMPTPATMMGGHPLRFVSANGWGPSTKALMNVSAATTTRSMVRSFFVIGSGDVTEMHLSFYAWYLKNSNGFVTLGNPYLVIKASIEYNGTYVPVTFSGARTKAISDGDTDIQSDPITPTAFSLAKFAAGSSGYVRLELEFATPATDGQPSSGFSTVGGNTQFKFDPAKSGGSVTNGVDSTGPLTYACTSPCVNGTDYVFINLAYFTPAILGRFANGNPKSWVLLGDSKTYGTNDTANGTSVTGTKGLSRAMFPDITSTAGAIASWNLGSPSGAAADWALGNFAYVSPYLKYLTGAIESYGTNSVSASASQAIHAQLRTAGIKQIIRTSLTPRTASYGSAYCKIPISALTSVTTTATATVADTTNLTSGQVYPIAGASPSAYNGNQTITVVDSTHFTYTFAGGTSPATGTIYGDDRFRTEAFQTATSGWSNGGTVDTFETAMKALVTSDLTYIDLCGTRGTTHWMWKTTGAINYETSDGLHQTAQGYEDSVGTTCSVINAGGTTTGTLRALVAAP